GHADGEDDGFAIRRYCASGGVGRVQRGKSSVWRERLYSGIAGRRQHDEPFRCHACGIGCEASDVMPLSHNQGCHWMLRHTCYQKIYRLMNEPGSRQVVTVPGDGRTTVGDNGGFAVMCHFSFGDFFCIGGKKMQAMGSV